MLYRVVMPHFVAGVLVRDDMIYYTAPILAWAKGKYIRVLGEWVRRRGGTCQAVAEEIHRDPWEGEKL